MKVVDCQAVVDMKASAPLVHLCPHKDEVDNGAVTIRWTTLRGKTIELHSLREWLDSFAETKISHEELTQLIEETVSALPVAGVTVETSWRTAGMAVSCST